MSCTMSGFVPKYDKRAGKNRGKLSQYALQILDFTLNMPHDFVGPVPPPSPPSYNIMSTPLPRA